MIGAGDLLSMAKARIKELEADLKDRTCEVNLRCGQIQERDRTIAYLQAELKDADGAVLYEVEQKVELSLQVAQLREAFAECLTVTPHYMVSKATAEKWKALAYGTSTPPSREWVGLSDEEIFELCPYIDHDLLEEAFYRGARAIEAKLREINGW